MPPSLDGLPTPDERAVPTNVVPIFDLFAAQIRTEQNLALTPFELVSDAGTSVRVSARLAFKYYIELLSEAPLDASTRYTIRATLPPGTLQPGALLSLSFTTGTGPLPSPPAPPDVRVQNYEATSIGDTCDPGSLTGSCVFFPAGSWIEVWRTVEPEMRELRRYARFDNLTGVPSVPGTCLSLRTRGPDGRMSDTVEVCGDDGETFAIPDTHALKCTNRGFEQGGVPLDGSGGATGGTGGAATGGSDTGGSDTGGGGAATGGSVTGGTSTGGGATGGTSTGGNGNAAGAPDDSDDSRTIVTDGCGCRMPGTSGRRSSLWLALGAALAVAGVRRAALRQP